MNPRKTDPWRVEITGRVVRTLSQLPRDEETRVLQALRVLTGGPWQGATRKLRGRPEWRLRIGSRRALFLVDYLEHSITVVDIGPRSDVYK
jgi:mRNA interferase RelE/StbE